MTQINEENLKGYTMQFAKENPDKLYLILDAVANVFYKCGPVRVADVIREWAIQMKEGLPNLKD